VDIHAAHRAPFVRRFEASGERVNVAQGIAHQIGIFTGLGKLCYALPPTFGAEQIGRSFISLVHFDNMTLPAAYS
jgi:hypothetical protein